MMSMVKQVGLTVLVGYLSLVMLTGCSTVHLQVQDPTSPVQFPSVLMEKVTLTVAVPPDQFKSDEVESADSYSLNNRERFERSLLSSIESSLVSSGAARNVSLAPSKGSWTMTVLAKWDSRDAWHERIWKTFQLFFLFLFLFIPMLFITGSFTVRTGAEVIITDPSGAERVRTSVETRMDAEVAFRKGSKEVFNQMYTVSSDELANRILLEMKRHPHWFEAVR
jgi:hypothetical protein